MKEITKFKNVSTKEGNIDFALFLNEIKNGKYKEQVSSLRTILKEKGKDEYDKQKKNLPGVTIAGTMGDKRNNESIVDYSGLIHLDYDYIENVEELRKRIEEISFTYASFISPSGSGLKVVIRTDAKMDEHQHYFNAIKKLYDKSLGLESDHKVKDLARLCFVSYDPNLYVKEASEIFSLSNKSTTASTKDINWVRSYVSSQQTFEEGNRNNYIHFFGNVANRNGIDISTTLTSAYEYSESGFPKSEIETAIRSAYKNTNEFNKYALPALTALPSFSSNVEKPYDSSPYIPNSIYQKLPEVLKEACMEFDGRGRDVFFTSSLSVISGGFYNVSGLYSGEETRPNLYSFVCAPPGSNKGGLRYSGMLGDCFHNTLHEKSKEEIKKYERAKKLYDLKVRKANTPDKIDALPDEPESPKVRVFNIPGNVSSSMLIKLLSDNDGIGCICETEADSLTSSWKQDWGNYSDILRKGFHGEKISLSRKTNLEFIEVEFPKISVALTGTPNQTDALITSIQDGLLSRFMYYSYVSEPKWKKTYTEEIRESKGSMFSEFSERLCDKFINSVEQKFKMTRKQGEKLDETFAAILQENVALYREEVKGVTFRLGLMCYKIAMVLTALRSDEESLTCSDDDFETALYLVEKVYLVHSIELLKTIGGKSSKLPRTQQDLLDWINSSNKNLTKSEILVKTDELGIRPRFTSDILTRFVNDNLIDKVSRGVYAAKR